jgi:secondary thiamine-phosphate synthase enzyme
VIRSPVGHRPAREGLSRPILIRAARKSILCAWTLQPYARRPRGQLEAGGANGASGTALWEHSFVMESEQISVATGRQERVCDITEHCTRFVSGAAGGGDGLLHVFVPHATAGLVLMELGSGSDDDLLAVLGSLLPADDHWQHAHGSAGHGRSHVMPAFLTPFLVVPVLSGRLALGTWQSIALVDLNVDNPDRHVRLSFLG